MRLVTIMRGIPGSGKSTYTRRFPKATVCSADHFFERDGQYRYDVSKIGEAHRACLLKFLTALQFGHEHVIVDNTHVKAYHVTPYAALAEAMGYRVEIVEMSCDPRLAQKRNVHSVPPMTVVRMYDGFERMPPPWNKLVRVESGTADDLTERMNTPEAKAAARALFSESRTLFFKKPKFPEDEDR